MIVKTVLLGETVSEYLVACRAGGLSPATIGAYRYGLARLVKHVSTALPLQDVTASGLRRWLAALADEKSARGRPMSESTVEQCYRSVHTFFVWCVANHYLEAGPMEGVKKPKVNREVPNFLSFEEMSKLRDALAGGRNAERNLAVGLVFLDCGARREEVALLAVHDVDLATGKLTIRRGKGGKGRGVPLSPSTVFVLRMWLAVRPLALGKSLFGMSGMAIYLMVRRAAARAGVEISVHGLRHTFATHYEGPLDDLQKILGHASIETTVTTYRHKLEAEMMVHHAERSPVAHLTKGKQLKLDFSGGER